MRVQVTMLIEAGADCNQQSVGDQYSPLHVAAKNGNHLVGVALIMAGCDPDLTDDNGLAVTTPAAAFLLRNVCAR